VVTAAKYRIERAAPADARDALARIWGANLTLEADAATKYRWLYEEAPDRPPVVFLLVADGAPAAQAVGTAGVGLRRVVVGDAELRAGLLGDLAVDREHRSVMPALSLVREAKAWALGELDFAYGFPNKSAEGVFKRAGYKPLGTIGRYVRVLRHAGYVDRVGDAELARVPARLRPALRAALAGRGGAALARGVDVAVLARDLPAVVRARDLRLALSERADPRLDPLWASARGDHVVVGARTARFVDWRFFRSGAGGRQLVLATDRAGAPQAYAVVERADEVAIVRDIFGHRAAMPALLDRLAPALYRRGVASISLRYLGASWFADALRARRFTLRQQDRMIALATSDRLAAATAARVADVEAWHITDADEDV
jgi:hypothetical protein